MSTQIKQIRFLSGRRHKFRKPKSSITGLSEDQIYRRKQEQRRLRAAEINKNSSLKEYIDWIWNLKQSLGMTSQQFADRIGVSVQTVRLWLKGSGHFPSERSFKKLLELEIESKIPIKVINIKYGVRM